VPWKQSPKVFFPLRESWCLTHRQPSLDMALTRAHLGHPRQENCQPAIHALLTRANLFRVKSHPTAAPFASNRIGRQTSQGPVTVSPRRVEPAAADRLVEELFGTRNVQSDKWTAMSGVHEPLGPRQMNEKSTGGMRKRRG
jgi:hypothetical protein